MINQVEIRRLTWPLQNIPLFYLQKLLGCFCCMFWVIVHLYCEAQSNQLCWIWAESISLYTLELIQLLLSSVTSSLNTSNPVPLEVMLMPSHCSTVLHRWCCVLWIMSCSKPSPYFFLPVILVQVDLNFSHPKNAFPEVVWLFLDVFWHSLIWPCFLLVVNPLYLLSWSLDCTH